MFLQFARNYGGHEQTDQKWKSLLDFEGELIKSFGKKERIHG
jgi:tRNA 2-(methylsulfanyl)-N6-isopentenyladenosine37 hydroxylase